MFWTESLFCLAFYICGMSRSLYVRAELNESLRFNEYQVFLNKTYIYEQAFNASIAHSLVGCAVQCTIRKGQCFSVIVHPLKDSEKLWQCELSSTAVYDVSKLAERPGYRYLVVDKAHFWKNYDTGVEGLSSTCSMCICRASGCENNIGICQGSVCGPYRMSQAFWCDGNYVTPCNTTTHDAAYRSCAKEMPCSQNTFAAYMNRYKDTCTGGESPVCRHYAIITESGPFSCSNPPQSALDFWNGVSACCDEYGGC